MGRRRNLALPFFAITRPVLREEADAFMALRLLIAPFIGEIHFYFSRHKIYLIAYNKKIAQTPTKAIDKKYLFFYNTKIVLTTTTKELLWEKRYGAS